MYCELVYLLFMHECHITGDKSRETEMIQAKEYSVLSTSLLFVWNIQSIILKI